MVNLGRSKGCNTCRQRRVRCDETKPTCRRCAALGRTCGGYERKIPPVRFKLVQTSENYVSKGVTTRTTGLSGPRTPSPPLVPALAPAEDDVALCFFINHFAVKGGEMLSSRGFFAFIQPVLCDESSNSAMNLAVATLSICMYSRYRSWPGSPKAGMQLGRALKQLQADIEDPLRSKSDATLLATLVLQFHDNLAAVTRLRRVQRTHHDGAVALLRHRGKDVSKSIWGPFLLSHVLNTETSSAIREKRSMTEEDLRWLDYKALPAGPSTALDLIGISVANLQHEFLHLKTGSWGALLSEAEEINDELLEWMATIPAHWRPYRVEQVPQCIPPILAYDGKCDVYATVHFATILNTWRCYRLIALKISLALRSMQSPSQGEDDNPSTHGNSAKDREGTLHAIDGICATVPFLLGNRCTPSTLIDFTDPSLRYPNYHSLPLASRPPAMQPHIRTSPEEHHRQVLAQGMWHIMSPLSHVVSSCSDTEGHLVMGCLREGQMEWLRGQLWRTGLIMRVDFKGMNAESKGRGGKVSSGSLEGEKSREDRLAEGLRDGLRLTSGS